MSQRAVEILVVEGDLELGGMIERQLTSAFFCNVTLTSSIRDALREELTARHDLVLTSAELPDGDGLAFVRELRAGNDCPVVLMAEEISIDQVVEAMRLGVMDLLEKPFDLAQATEMLQQAAEGELKHRREQARYRRLRRVAKRIVRERKDVNHRMDLICRDFVQAYRRLAEKVNAAGLLERHAAE
jgi:DNA-binding NtrC family response regulator